MKKELAESLKNSDSTTYLFKPLTGKAREWWIEEFGDRFYKIDLGTSRFTLKGLSAWEHSFMVPSRWLTTMVTRSIIQAGFEKAFKKDHWETFKLARTVLFGHRQAEEEFSDMYYAAEEDRGVYADSPY